MTEPKEYTREEFEESLIEIHQGDVAALVASVLKHNEWLIDGYGVAQYFNAALSERSYWDRCYTRVHPSAAMRPDGLIPDPNGLSSSYALQGVYFGEKLDLAEMVKKIKVIRPAVVFVDAGYDENGVSRRAWAIYREQKLFRVIPDDNMPEHLWEDYGVEKEWASGKLPVTEEVWEQLWDKTEWPTTHQRFEDYIAEELYNDTLSSFQDEDVSSENNGTGAYRFNETLQILYTDSQGYVTYETFGDESDLDRKWDEIVAEYFPDEEEDGEE